MASLVKREFLCVAFSLAAAGTRGAAMPGPRPMRTRLCLCAKRRKSGAPPSFEAFALAVESSHRGLATFLQRGGSAGIQRKHAKPKALREASGAFDLHYAGWPAVYKFMSSSPTCLNTPVRSV